jgi:glutathione S-transferase
MLRLHDFTGSGNVYKARLMLGLLDAPYEIIQKYIMTGEAQTSELLAMNPNDRIPLLELEPGDHLAESDAIL